ncbi:MAG: cysteine--tRNA ligase [Caulobacteraceae bacterium]
MKVYNTLTRKKEEFVPLVPGEVRMYSCGPTVYNYAHIGNMRSYVFMDILRRVLKYNGYKLKSVMNITDVGHLVSDADEGEDKLVKTAKEQKKTPWEIAEYYTNIFFEDLKALNIERPDIVPKATEHINEMIEFVQGILRKGYGYETSDGIYYDISKFKGYGKLSGIDLEGQRAGARVEVNDEKRNPADFALWKHAPKEHIMQWPSPWGMGYPGWHIECSAMSRKYLGDVFDIHTGGVDHIPIHHENEIAQSEGLLGKPAVNYWMHGEFLLVDNGKMSKSLGNTYTVADLKAKGFNPLAFRYFCLNAVYRNKLNFTWEALQSAQTALDRLYEGALAHKSAPEDVEQGVLDAFLKEFEEAINDDLNIPKAMSVVWNIIKHPVKSDKFFQLLVKMDSVLGLGIDKVEKKEKVEESISEDIERLIEERQKARKEKNWALADKIRDDLKAQGIILEDTPQGVKWKRI